jgi:hypothetical protein
MLYVVRELESGLRKVIISAGAGSGKNRRWVVNDDY